MEFSESTKNIFKALSEFKADFKQPIRDADNPYYGTKYVPLENIVEMIDKTAPKHGLSYMQNTSTRDDGYIGIQTIIGHSSGEYIIFDYLYLKPDKQTVQGAGSAITYGRRYALSSAFGVASDKDDDGNKAEDYLRAELMQTYENIIMLDKQNNVGLYDTNAKINKWIKDNGKINDLKETPKNETIAWAKRLEKNLINYEG